MRPTFILVWFYFLQLIQPSVVVNAIEGKHFAVHFKQHVSSMREGILLEAQVWMEGEQVRTEFFEGDRFVVIIMKEGQVWHYLPQQNSAVKTFDPDSHSDDVLSPDLLQSPQLLKNFLSSHNAHMKNLETVRGVLCENWVFEDANSSEPIHIWLDQEHFFPIQSSVKVNGDVITVQYLDIEFDPDIKDHFFELPAGVLLRDETQEFSQDIQAVDR